MVANDTVVLAQLEPVFVAVLFTFLFHIIFFSEKHHLSSHLKRALRCSGL